MEAVASINPAALLNNQAATVTLTKKNKYGPRRSSDTAGLLRLLRADLDYKVYKKFAVEKTLQGLRMDAGFIKELVRIGLLSRTGNSGHDYTYKLDEQMRNQSNDSFENLYRKFLDKAKERRAAANPEKYAPKRSIEQVKQAVETGMQINPLQDITPAWSNGFDLAVLEKQAPLKQLTTSWSIDGVTQGVTITVEGAEGDDYQKILRKGLAILDYTC